MARRGVGFGAYPGRQLGRRVPAEQRRFVLVRHAGAPGREILDPLGANFLLSSVGGSVVSAARGPAVLEALPVPSGPAAISSSSADRLLIPISASC